MWDELPVGETFDDDVEDAGVDDELQPALSGWRRRSAMWIAGIVAVSMMSVPLWNVLEARQPPVADNGLEMCGFDYCDVFEAVRQAGYDAELLRLANRYLSDEEARSLTDRLVAELGTGPVTVRVVDRLPGATAGRFMGSERLIELQRPVRTWTVVHEAAHTVGGGHGAEFQDTLVDLIDWMDRTGRID